MNQQKKLTSQIVQGPQGKLVTIQEVFQQQNGYTLYTTSDNNFLIKVYDSEKYTQTERNAFRLLKTHPNIVKTQEAEMLLDSKVVQVMLMEKGIIMEKILTKLQNLNERQVLKILKDLAKALTYIHSQGVIHRNIRTPSIIFGKDGKFKIQNFHNAAFQIFNKVPSEIRQQIREDIELNTDISIRAPEQIDVNSGFPLTEKVDIFGLGCLAYQAVYNRPYDQKNPLFTANTDWSTFSDKLCYLIKIMLANNPKDRPTSYQIEQYLETFHIQQSSPEESQQSQEATTPTHVHIRSKSQNSSLQITDSQKKPTSEELNEKFQGLEWIQLKQSPNQENKSSFYTRCIKIISKFSNKTEGWVIACIEENEEGPQQKYIRFLIVKAWTKKEKISKFYSALNQKLKKNSIENTVVTLKSLILLHNYFKKGPLEVLSIDNKEFGPEAILKKIHFYWTGAEQSKNKYVQKKNTIIISESSAKDKTRSGYTTQIIKDYSQLLLEKLRLCLYYSSYFEGNYSLNPFFNSMLKTYKPLTIGMLENLLRYWEKCLIFSSTLFKEAYLVRIQFSLGLSIIDEIYCLLSLLSHILFAFKHSTNYIEYSQTNVNFTQLRDRIILLENQFVKNYTLSSQFLNQCYNSPLFRQISSMIPQLKLSLLDVIKSVPLFQQTKGDFNIFDYLSYGKNLEGIKLPLSYGQAVSNIKLENEELINLNIEDERLRTVNYNNYNNYYNKDKDKDEIEKSSKKDTSLIKESQTVRDNRFEHMHHGSDVMETIKKGPLSAKEQSSNYSFPEPAFSKKDFEKLSKLTQSRPDEQFSQNDVYNEFSHQTISHDFNQNVTVPDQEKQKNLKLFEYDQTFRNPIQGEEKQLIMNQEVKEIKPIKELNKQKTIGEKLIDQKKNNFKKQNSGYQDLSFSEDEIEDGPGLNEFKPIQTMEFGQQKTIITRAMVENSEFLAPITTKQNRQLSPQQVNLNINELLFQDQIIVSNNKRILSQNQNNNNPFLQEDFQNQQFQQTQLQANEQKNIFNYFNPIERSTSQNNLQMQQQQVNKQWYPQNNIPPQQQSSQYPGFGIQQNNYFQQQQLQTPSKPVINQQVQQQTQLQQKTPPYSQILPQFQQQQPLQVTQPFSQQLKLSQQQVPQIQQYQQQLQQQLYPQNVPIQPNPAIQQQPEIKPPEQPAINTQPTQAFELYKFITQELQTNAADWIINANQLTIDKQIGTGSSCDVFKGYWRGNEVAIKKMKIKSITENHMKEFRREITALVKIKPHKNLVSLLGISQKDDELYIITEYCAGGTLFDLLHRKKNIVVTWPVRIRVCLQIAAGMAYLHEMIPPIIHRDLKSLKQEWKNLK